MLSADEANPESDPNRPIFDHFTNTNSTHTHQTFNENLLSHQASAFSNHQHFSNQTQTQTHQQLHSLYDPRAYGGASPYASTHPALLSLDHSVPGGGGGYFLVPKSEEVSRPLDFTSRIGLNLGGRTYFSSADDDFVNRLYRRSRPGETGSANSPRCQAEGCNADLSHAKHYHRRHKVCEFHSKASTVIAAGLTQRFCQQCSRFHLLSEFDNGKRSCRKRLADHNRRRRKSHQPTQDHNHKSVPENPRNCTSDHQLSRSPQDSGAQSSSSVTVAVSPPRILLDCFRQRSYPATESSSATGGSSLFFSTG